MSFEPRDYLRHILVEIDYLVGQSAGLTSEAFRSDETLRRAFVRSIEIIGEAAKKVPDSFRAEHPAIEWRAMAGMSSGRSPAGLVSALKELPNRACSRRRRGSVRAPADARRWADAVR